MLELEFNISKTVFGWNLLTVQWQIFHAYRGNLNLSLTLHVNFLALYILHGIFNFHFRSKTHEIITEYSDNSRSSWDSTPSVHDSLSDLDITPCGSPWASLSLEDSILLNCSVESSRENASSSNNKSK